MLPLKKFTLVLLFVCCFTATMHAETGLKFHPVVALSTGVNLINLQQNVTNNFASTQTNTFTGSANTAQPVVGLFAGFEMPFAQGAFAWQWGLSYYQALSSVTMNGTSVEPHVGAYSYVYSYNIAPTQALLFDNKFLMRWHQIYHPYVSAGMGMARNSTSGYASTLLTPSGQSPYLYADKSTQSVSYEMGAGLDVDIKRFAGLRIGLGYRYVNLGTASLGTGVSSNNSPGPDDPNGIDQTLTAQEILLQLSYVF